MQSVSAMLRKENEELRAKLGMQENSHKMIIDRMRSEYELQLRAREGVRLLHTYFSNLMFWIERRSREDGRAREEDYDTTDGERETSERQRRCRRRPQ